MPGTGEVPLAASRKLLQDLLVVLQGTSRTKVKTAVQMIQAKLGPPAHPLFAKIKKGDYVLLGVSPDERTAVGMVTSVGDTRATVVQYNGGKGRLTIRRDGSAAYYFADIYLLWVGKVPKDCQGYHAYNEAIIWIREQLERKAK